MRLREKPLRPWVIAGKDSVVKAAHCTCMVGLGEACSHVAALLFCIDATVRIRDSKTVTENPAYWMLPAAFKAVSYKQLRDVDFTSAKGLKRNLDESISHPSSACDLPKPLPKVAKTLPTTPDELHTLFRDLCAT